MQVCPGIEFGLAMPLQLSTALCALYYLDTKDANFMKSKIVLMYDFYYCNTAYYTFVSTPYYDA